MSWICKTFSQIASPTPCVWTRVINVSQQSREFLDNDYDYDYDHDYDYDYDYVYDYDYEYLWLDCYP